MGDCIWLDIRIRAKNPAKVIFLVRNVFGGFNWGRGVPLGAHFRGDYRPS